MLASHDMFRHMRGNPTSITMMASIHFNPLIQNSLVDMYQSIRSEQNILVEELDCNYGGKVIPRQVENIMSLNVAAEISVKLLESSNKEDMDLLYFLGCLPGGVTEEQLLKLWNNDVSESLERINALSFFEIGIERLQLTPTMINYI